MDRVRRKPGLGQGEILGRDRLNLALEEIPAGRRQILNTAYGMGISLVKDMRRAPR